jgi:hypothetical protein
MTFEERWAVFVQKNPSLARAETIEIQLVAFKRVAKQFFDSGRDDRTTLDSPQEQLRKKLFPFL